MSLRLSTKSSSKHAVASKGAYLSPSVLCEICRICVMRVVAIGWTKGPALCKCRLFVRLTVHSILQGDWLAVTIYFFLAGCLTLYNNNMTGTFPDGMNLGNLFCLDVEYNNMSGTISADWVEGGHNVMKSLRHLCLCNNRCLFLGRPRFFFQEKNCSIEASPFLFASSCVKVLRGGAIKDTAGASNVARRKHSTMVDGTTLCFSSIGGR